MAGENTTLAQRIRSRYPGAYDDMSDQQLEAAVSAKYPGVYDDIPRSGAGESVGQDTSVSADSRRPAFAPGVMTGAAMKSAPALVAGVHTAAKGVGAVARKAASAGRYAPALIAADAVRDVVDGRPGAAASKVAGAAAASRIPAFARAVERATRPTTGVSRGAAGRFVAGAATPLRRAAGVVSRAAGPVGLAVEAIFGDGAAGHRPYGETAETIAERQRAFQAEYDELVQASRRTPITSPLAERIRTRLGELMTLLGTPRNRR